jgi:signal transduction histidine kinase
VLGTLIDISERQRLEVELRHAQKLEAVGQLAAGIAHEINTPIQFIGDNVHFLRDAFDDLTALIESYRSILHEWPDAGNTVAIRERLCRAERETDLDYLRTEVPAAASHALDGVQRVASIVSAMKAFGHPDRGEPGLVDLNTALRNTITVARNEYKYVADIDLDLSALPLVPCIAGDLNQVFLNLIINAAHAIADAVQGTDRRGRISVRTRHDVDDDAVVIAISDTGTGIAPEHAPHIFEPFFTTKEVGRGTGQGLALAHTIVSDRHGGSLTFDSVVGEGTTFTIRLPLRGPAEAKEA